MPAGAVEGTPQGIEPWWGEFGVETCWNFCWFNVDSILMYLMYLIYVCEIFVPVCSSKYLFGHFSVICLGHFLVVSWTFLGICWLRPFAVLIFLIVFFIVFYLLLFDVICVSHFLVAFWSLSHCAILFVVYVVLDACHVQFVFLAAVIFCNVCAMFLIGGCFLLGRPATSNLAATALGQFLTPAPLPWAHVAHAKEHN